jgi:hypothetical protein
MTPELCEDRLRLGAEVAADYGHRPGVLGTYLAGSLAAGLGTPGSDIDVMVVVEELDTVPANEVVLPEQLRRSDCRIDVEYISAARIGALRSLGDPFDLSMRNPRPWWLAVGLDDGIRMLTSRDVVPAECVVAARTHLVRNQAEVRRRVIAYQSIQYSMALEDLWGFLADEEWETALDLCLSCVAASLAAIAAAAGQLYLGRKWLWRKLKRTGVDDATWAACRALFEPADVAGPQAADTVIARLNVAQSILARAVLAGWSTDEPAASPPFSLSGQAFAVGRNPWLTPTRTVDGPVLFDIGGKATRLSPEGMLLWAAFDDRRDGDENVAAFLTEWRRDIPAADVKSYLDRLRELGLLGTAARWAGVATPLVG